MDWSLLIYGLGIGLPVLAGFVTFGIRVWLKVRSGEWTLEDVAVAMEQASEEGQEFFNLALELMQKGNVNKDDVDRIKKTSETWLEAMRRLEDLDAAVEKAKLPA